MAQTLACFGCSVDGGLRLDLGFGWPLALSLAAPPVALLVTPLVVLVSDSAFLQCLSRCLPLRGAALLMVSSTARRRIPRLRRACGARAFHAFLVSVPSLRRADVAGGNPQTARRGLSRLAVSALSHAITPLCRTRATLAPTPWPPPLRHPCGRNRCVKPAASVLDQRRSRRRPILFRSKALINLSSNCSVEDREALCT